MAYHSSAAVWVLVALPFIILCASAASLTVTPAVPTMSNIVIDVGQIAIANTVVSGGTGPYQGEWAWIPASNFISNNAVNTIDISPYFNNIPLSLVFNPSGTLSYMSTYRNSGIAGVVNVTNSATNAVVGNSIPVGFGNYNLAINPSGTLLYVVNYGSGTVNVISTSSNTVINTITVGGTPFAVAFNPSGTLAYVTNEGSSFSINVINVAANAMVRSIPFGINEPFSVEFNPQGTFAYVTTGASTMLAVNVISNTISNTISGTCSQPDGLAISPNGTLAYISCWGSGTTSPVNKVSLITNTTVNTITIPGTEGGVELVLSPSGVLGYVSNYNNGAATNTLTVLNVVTNTVINMSSTGVTTYVQNGALLAINPSGTFVYVRGGSNGEGVNVISTPETAVQPLNTIQTNNGLLQLTINAISATSISFTFNGVTYKESPHNGQSIYGNYIFYGFGEDSTTGLAGITGLTGTNTVTASNILTINPALLDSWSVTINPISKGATQTLTATTDGGTGSSPWTYNILVYNAIGSLVYNSLSPYISSTTNAVSFIQNAAWGSGTFTANVYITDSATTPVTVSNTLTYNALATNTLIATPNPYTLTNKTIDIGQVSTANTVVSNGIVGTVSYTGNWVWYPPTSSNIVVANTIFALLPTSNNALSLTINAVSSNSLKMTFNGVAYYANSIGINTIYGTWTFNAFASDANGDNSPTPQLTNTITINSALVAAAMTESNTVIDNTQYSTLTSNPSGGSGSDTVNWFLSATCGGGSVHTGTTYPVNPSSSSTYTYNVVDSATTPNAVCSASNTVTVHSTPTLTTLTPSNSVLDSGQYVTYNVVLNGGTGPFTINLINTAGSGTVVNTIIWSTLTPISNIITFGANIPATPSQTFNVIATDTGTIVTPFVFNSVSNTVTVNGALVAAAITESNTIIDNTQYSTLTSNPSGGSGSYTINWFLSATCGGGSVHTGTTYPVNPSSSSTYTYNVVDSATTPNSVCSASNTVTVHSTPTLTSLTPSNVILVTGQSVTYNVVLSGGTGPFTVNLLNTGTSAVINTISWPTLTPVTNIITFGFNIPAIGTDTFNVVATDTGPVITPFVFNSAPNTITISGGSSPTTTIPSGGGGGPARQTLTLNDNLSSSITSNVPVFTVYIINSSGTTKQTYNQNNLPAMITYTLPATINFAFACAFGAGPTTYRYAGDVYGLGFSTPCGTNYTTYGGSYTVLYLNASKPVPTTTTLTTTSTTGSSISSSTIPSSSNAPVTETIAVEPNKTTAVGFYNNLTVVRIYSSASGILNVTLRNLTASSSAPPNYTKFSVFYLNVSNGANISVNITEAYNCSIPAQSLRAFYLSNNTWVPIYKSIAIARSCTITFAAPNMHTIGLFIFSSAPTTTIPPITSTSTIPQPPARSSFPLIPAVIAVIIILVVAAAVYALSKRKR